MNSRQQNLLDKLSKTGSLETAEEAALLKVSAMTLWRDFKMFEEQGLALRTHGGLVSAIRRDLGFQNTRASEFQKKIAKAAISLIPNNSTIMLSAGTTTLEIARQLASSGRLQITVVTNSLPVAAIFYKTDFNTILLGGSLRRNSMDLTGPLSEKNLDELHIDMLFTGCDGAISGEGFFTSDLSLAELERKSVQRSKTVAVVTESRKFGKKSLAKFASDKEVRIVVTDRNLSNSDKAMLEKNKIKVCIAY
ncbi:MAG: DeoR/GlpR family DNA-binding transcription regulator [Victivallales bacterium]|jgi:DeoR family transcriptional regulator of aga operon